MTRIISVANQKGGVGKTTTTFNLAYELSKKNKKVLCVDLDMQGNLTNLFGVSNKRRLESTISTLFDIALDDDEITEEDIKLISNFNIDLIPANRNLSITESRLKTEMGTDRILKEVINTINSKKEYDYILLDLSPSFNTLTMNALTCSDSVIIPMTAEYLSFMGLNDFLMNVDRIKKRLNRFLKVEGVLLTMVDNRLNVTKMIKEDVRISLNQKYKVFDTEIPSSTEVSKGELEGKPISVFNSSNKVSIAYKSLADEILSGENHDNV